MNFPSLVGVLTDLDMREGQTKTMKGKRGEAGDGGLWDGDILDAMRLARSKRNEEGVGLVGVILGHRSSESPDCAESSQLGMIRCTQGLWIREILPREELH